MCPRQGGGLVRLDNLVKLVPTKQPHASTAWIASARSACAPQSRPGIAQADRIAALREEVARMELPPGYSTRVSGRARELETTFREFLWAFLLSVILMYIILASQFESLVHPFTILLSLPLSVPFAFALAAGGATDDQSLLRAGHARAVRRGQEECHSANRPHEQAARPRHGPALGASCRAIATGSGPSS